MKRIGLNICFTLTLVFGFRFLVGQSIPNVTVGVTAYVDQLNPVTNFNADVALINEYLYMSLLRADKQTGQYLPLVAASLPSISGDKRNYTYTINPLAKFNNGLPITAEDVVFSLKLHANPYIRNTPNRSHYALIQNVVATDAQTVRIEMKAPAFHGIQITSDFAIFSENVFDPDQTLRSIALRQLQNPSQLTNKAQLFLKSLAARVQSYGISALAFAEGNACGPYVVEDWKVGQKIMLVANKKFWGRKMVTDNPYFKQNVDHIEIRCLTKGGEMAEALAHQQLDILFNIQPTQYTEFRHQLKAAGYYQFVEQRGQTYEYIGMNMGRGQNTQSILADATVRRALAHMVHVEQLLAQVRSSQGERIAADVTASTPGFDNPNLVPPSFDTELTAKLLTEAGWVDTDGDGLRDKYEDGEHKTLVLKCLVNQNRPYRAEIAQHLQQEGLKLGMIISYEELPWEQYLSKLAEGSFDMYIGAWISDPKEDSYRSIWHTASQTGGANFVGFGNADTDALIESYELSFNESERKELSHELQRIQATLQPYIFLWRETNNLIVNSKYAKYAQGGLRPGFWIGSFE